MEYGMVHLLGAYAVSNEVERDLRGDSISNMC